MHVKHRAPLTATPGTQPDAGEVSRNRRGTSVTFDEELPIEPDLFGGAILYEYPMMPEIHPEAVIREGRKGSDRCTNFTITGNVTTHIKVDSFVAQRNIGLEPASSCAEWILSPENRAVHTVV